jgi:hypothetical protein
MKIQVLVGALLSVGSGLGAQVQPVSPRDSAARADSIARADSLALVREIEELQRGDTDTTAGRPQFGAQAGVIQRLLPDISVVGDFIADLSPEGSTQEDGSRLGVREVELAFQAAVDPYFRGDVFLGFNDVEGVGVEQAFLTTSSLPFGLELKLGRFLMPVGKQNTTHRHDLHTVDYAYVNKRFLGEEGLKGTGFGLSKIFAPFGFYQELQLTAVERFGEAPEDLVVSEPINKQLDGLAYSARLRNYWDLNESTNLELAGFALTAKTEQPFEEPPVDDINAIPGRRTLTGLDFTFRWRPLQQGLYKSFILQAEFMNRRDSRAGRVLDVPPNPPTAVSFAGDSHWGTYVFARYQLTRRGFLGARYDQLKDPEFGGETTRAASAYLQFFPSEFSKLMAAYERFIPPAGNERINRILLQATFALGPHKPHPF